MPRALWAKAPFALLRHRSVLVAVACASFLVALAAASAPLLRAGAESEALKGKLDLLTPLAAGLTIETVSARDRDLAGGDRARRAAARRLAHDLPFVGEPILTTTTFARVGGKVLEGGIPLDVVPMARTGATAHVRRLSGDGHGAWLAARVVRLARVGPGDQVELIPPPGFGGPRRGVLRVPVGAVYVPLDADLGNPYWVDFIARIRNPNPDAPPLPTFLLMSQDEVYRAARIVGGGTVANVFEFPVETRSMTPGRAKDVAAHFAAIRRSLARPTPFARSLGCGACHVSSSIEAAVRLSAQSVDALTPVISLLAGFAALIAVAAAFVAGVFNVRRRSAEARLSVVGGESRALFGVRSALESAAPALLGAAAGLLCATVLGRMLTPTGTVDGTVVRSALASTALAAAVSIAAVAAGVWVARGPAIERAALRHRLAIAWELPVLAAAAISYALIEHGGGLVKDATIGSHPRLVVLLFPLLVAAGLAGVASRVARALLRRREAGSNVVFLALRRLAAARALLVLLVVTAAVSCCALTFAEVLDASLGSNSAEKAYVANGGDVQGLIDPLQALPRTFPYPLAKVEQSFDSARLDDGTSVELLAVEPVSLRRVIHWRWSGDPRAALARLEASSAFLPAIAVGAAAHARAVWIGGKRISVRVVATVPAFPGMVAGEPLLVVPSARLTRAAPAVGITNPLEGANAYVWGRGEPRAVEAALARSALAPSFLTSVDYFLQSADLTTAARTYGFLRVIAFGAAAVALLALLLYLHARSRSQLVTAAFLTRMGLRRSRQAASVALEAAALVAFAAIAGAGSALLAAAPIVSRVDPLPRYAPSATVDVPWLLLAASLCLLVVVAAAAGAAASVLAGREDLGEALRVA